MIIAQSAPLLDREDIAKLLSDELGDLLHCENMLLKALPKFLAGSSGPGLKSLFETHLEQTRSHADRVVQMFESLDLPAREKKCEAMMGLLTEAQHLLTRGKPSLALDQALIGAARKVETFEAVAYETLAAWAEFCGLRRIRDLALQIATEENAANRELAAMVPRPEAPSENSPKPQKPKINARGPVQSR